VIRTYVAFFESLSGVFRLLSIRWVIAIAGCLNIMRGPEYLITSLILARISGR
jgi:hypothetical protein